MMLQKTLKEGKILVLDIETISKESKVNKHEDLIAEIGITAINLFNGSKQLIYNKVVNEGIKELMFCLNCKMSAILILNLF